MTTNTTTPPDFTEQAERAAQKIIDECYFEKVDQPYIRKRFAYLILSEFGLSAVQPPTKIKCDCKHEIEAADCPRFQECASQPAATFTEQARREIADRLLEDLAAGFIPSNELRAFKLQAYLCLESRFRAFAERIAAEAATQGQDARVERLQAQLNGVMNCLAKSQQELERVRNEAATAATEFFCYWLARIYEAGHRDTSYEEGETLNEALRNINQVLGFAGYEPDDRSREALLKKSFGWQRETKDDNAN